MAEQHRHQITSGIPGCCLTGTVTIEGWLCGHKAEGDAPIIGYMLSRSINSIEQTLDLLRGGVAYFEARLAEVLAAEEVASAKLAAELDTAEALAEATAIVDRGRS